MAVARVTTWSSGQTLTATALNAEFDNLLTPINAILPGSYGTGDLLYASSGTQWAALGAGTQNFVLQMGASIPAWFNLFGTANTFTANQTISNTAPKLTLSDTTASAKSLTIAVDANIADLRESAGASGSLLVLDLANDRIGIGTTNPSRLLSLSGGNIGFQEDGTTRSIVWGTTGSSAKTHIDAREGASGYMVFGTNSTERLRVDVNGNVGIGMTPTQQFELSGSVGQKASGTTWSNPSDARLKENVRDYTDGLNVILNMRPVHYELNGLAGTPKGQRGISVIAQEQVAIMPYTIDTYQAKLHSEDEQETELYRFEASAVTFALVNAVKELAAQIGIVASSR